MYFAKLEMSRDPASAELAVHLAARAIEEAKRELDIVLVPDDLAALDRVFEVLAMRHEEAALSPEEFERVCQLYGGFLGQTVLARTGGYWAEVTQFGERMSGGLVLGAANIKFWPRVEVRDRIEGGATTSLDDRIRDLCERATATSATAVERTYTLAPEEGYFEAGLVRDGRQTLMAVFVDATFGIFFAPDGTLLEYVERHPATDATLHAWQDELGFEPHAIRIRKFEIPSQGLGIEDLPSHLADFVEDPQSEPDPDERAELSRSIRRWLQNESFVLYWGNDLWLDGSGHVTSS
jgi:hypothetical protein